MASSSVSQEDLEQEFELSSRRSRVARSARTRAVLSVITTTANVDEAVADAGSGHGSGLYGHNLGDGQFSMLDHDTSPKPAARAKDKRTRPLNKGKQQRDRRKLREKRRSTGVVHLPSTESTGGSTGEDEEELLAMTAETKRNTLQNEIIDKDNNANRAEDKLPKSFTSSRNKRQCTDARELTMPRAALSDLDADDEDNQDYDSTVNQSDSTMSLKQECGVVAADRNWTRTTNGRPDTPNTDNLEELLERAREENRNLLELLADKDRKIAILEREVSRLSRDLQVADTENDKLKEDNKALIRAMAQLQVT